MNTETDCQLESRILYTPSAKPDAYHSLSFPVYNAVAYEFDNAEEMEDAFCGRNNDFSYSRITNPTVDYFERRISALTGAPSVTALGTGMAAICNTLMTIAYNGCNIVTSVHLFGNTYSLLASTLAAFGVEVRFCDLLNPTEVIKRIDEHTCAIFLEIITNPQMEVADLHLLSTLAHEAGVPLIADTTVLPPHAFDAKQFGVDINLISSTKYISGGATSMGGLIIDYQRFDWSHSIRLSALALTEGTNAFTYKLRREIHRNLGAYMTPQAAYMQTLGLETLEVRYERQASTCLKLARLLKELPEIVSVNYIGLEDNPYYSISKAQFGEHFGAMLTFDLESREACFCFMNRLKLIRRATNLFDNKSLAIHPASTIFGTFTEKQRQSMNISQRTIRLSVGLESVEDLLGDIRQALVS